MAGFSKITVSNYRSLAEVSLDLEPVNVIIGANGSGKSTLLDCLWFFRDCYQLGVERAAAERHYGVGILNDHAKQGDSIKICLKSQELSYSISIGINSQRIDPFAGEELIYGNRLLIDRKIGMNRAVIAYRELESEARPNDISGAPTRPVTAILRNPESLSFSRLLDNSDEKFRPVFQFDGLLRSTRKYDSRLFDFQGLRTRASNINPDQVMHIYGHNLWNLLRILRDKSRTTKNYSVIVEYMKEAFPEKFVDFEFDQAADTVAGSFLETGPRELRKVNASAASDGYLQMIMLLTALFGADQKMQMVLLFDEPDLSLHPWALTVFAKAVEIASREWNRQILIATHSPVLMSQFEPHQILVADSRNPKRFERLSNNGEVRDLIEHYSVGSLYMAESIAPQSNSHSPA